MAPITLLTALPIFSTAEQHAEFQSRTPASGDFTHDPVLHHLEKGARITLEPPVDGFDAVTMSQLDVYVIEGCVQPGWIYASPDKGSIAKDALPRPQGDLTRVYCAYCLPTGL